MENTNNQDNDAKIYFTEQEWSCMVTIEKSRVTNMLRNYNYLKAQGIDAKPPDFVLRHENRKKLDIKIERSDIKSESIFVESHSYNSEWEVSQGETTYYKYWGDRSESLYPSGDKENISYRNISTNCNGNCSSFCQYCYILQQLKMNDTEINLLNFKENYSTKRIRVLPLRPSNRKHYNYQQDECYFPSAKPNTINQQQTKDVICQECGQKFARDKYLKCHLKRFSLDGKENENRPFKCMFCSHSFAYEKHRKFHERVHTGKSIPCCHCSLIFNDLSSCRNHIAESHKDKVHICMQCGMSYSNSSHLLRHVREVRRDYLYECSVCGHRYHTARSLTRHKIHHNRNKPFKCKVCLKTFSSKTHLTKHLNFGKMDRRFECSSCKVRFMTQKSLKKHERVFNEDRPYKCKICGHAYNYRPKLVHHMKVHCVA